MWFSIWDKITEWLNSVKVKVCWVGQGQWPWLTNNYSISKTPSNAEFVLYYITCFSCSDQKWGCFLFFHLLFFLFFSCLFSFIFFSFHFFSCPFLSLFFSPLFWLFFPVLHFPTLLFSFFTFLLFLCSFYLFPFLVSKFKLHCFVLFSLSFLVIITPLKYPDCNLLSCICLI